MFRTVRKTGHLRYFYKGLLSKKWKVYYFVLSDDSTLNWYEKQNDRKPEGFIRIRNVAQHLCVGVFTRCLYNRPQLPLPEDESNLIAIPTLTPGYEDKDIVWILCDNETHLNDWMGAIISTLPPPPRQPRVRSTMDKKVVLPQSIAPKPYPRSNPPGKRQQLIFSPVQESKQPTHNFTTVVVESLPPRECSAFSDHHQSDSRSLLTDLGLGFSNGAFIGGVWDVDFARNRKLDYGTDGIGCYYRYGRSNFNNQDTSIMNTYYDNGKSHDEDDDDITNNDIDAINNFTMYNFYENDDDDDRKKNWLSRGTDYHISDSNSSDDDKNTHDGNSILNDNNMHSNTFDCIEDVGTTQKNNVDEIRADGHNYTSINDNYNASHGNYEDTGKCYDESNDTYRTRSNEYEAGENGYSANFSDSKGNFGGGDFGSSGDW